MARTFLIPVDDTDGSQKAVDWTVANLVRPGDDVRLLHVIPVPAPEVVGGIGVAGAGDFVVTPPDPRVDRERVAKTEAFVARRFVPTLAAAATPYKAEILHFDTNADSVGQVVAARAKTLGAAAVVVAKHNKGAIKEMLLGSTAKYLTKHCEVPVTVLHG